VAEVAEVEEAEGDIIMIELIRRKTRGTVPSITRTITIQLVASKSRKLLSFTKKTKAAEKGGIAIIIPLPPIL